MSRKRKAVTEYKLSPVCDDILSDATGNDRKIFKRKKYARKNTIPKIVHLPIEKPFQVFVREKSGSLIIRFAILAGSLEKLQSDLLQAYQFCGVDWEVYPTENYRLGELCKHIPSLSTIPDVTSPTHTPQTELTAECKFALWNRQQQIAGKNHDHICGLGW